MPLSLLSSSGLAISSIAACVFLADREPNSKWVTPMVSAGQMAFTWYIGHIIVVVGAGILTDFGGSISMSFTYGVSAAFFAMMVIASHVYRHRFKLGPLA